MERIVLQTERCELVPPRPEFVDRVAEYCRDDEVDKWVTNTPLNYSREDAQEFVQLAEQWWDEDKPVWFILLDGDPIGHIGLNNPLVAGSRVELGYLLESRHRSHGYMTEAIKAVSEFAFSKGAGALGWACCVLDGETNWGSAKSAWKAGFTFDGIVRASLMHRGKLVDTLVGTLRPDDPREPRGSWLGPTDSRPAMPSPRDPEALVTQFHHTYGMPIRYDEPTVNFDRVDMRMSLIAEEFTELVRAVYGEEAGTIVEEACARAVDHDDQTRDVVESADALADLIYVIYGMALEAGIPLEHVLTQVQASNLSKLGADGKPIYREDGKVLKGPGFFPPDIATVLQNFRIQR